jgi:hypothetical protein
MSIWETYPPTYRSAETALLLPPLRRGDCAALVGLSGSGKSNLLGFLSNRPASEPASSLTFALSDCNRLALPKQSDLFSLLLASLNRTPGAQGETDLETAIAHRLSSSSGRPLVLVLDRFDALPSDLHGCLRALRDEFKYQLVYLLGSRRPMHPSTELAELFYAHTLWLGPLSQDDSFWSIHQFAARSGLDWDENVLSRLYELSWGYPGFLRAACEAYSAGCQLEPEAMRSHSAVQARVREFLSDNPSLEELQLSHLDGHPFLVPASMDHPDLTAKEALLLEYFEAHPGEICDKDDLIRAIWPEDKVFQDGIRDDSLAQLIRRLRRKIEPDASNPRHIFSVAGRGYRYRR